MYYEWCSEPNQRNGTFIPIEELNSKVGFRSVYGFKEQPNQSKGLNKYSVFSDTLIMDFDDGLEGEVLKVLDILIKEELTYYLYNSGNKGCHLHIPIVSMYGDSVPYSQKKFVEEHNFNCDLSIYKHSSLIRLVGTIHKKTGKLKELINFNEGAILEIPYMEEPKQKFKNVKPRQDDILYIALTKCAKLVGMSANPGERTNTIWSISRNFFDSGISFDTALELAYSINSTWSKPLEEAGVLRAVRQGYNL